MAGFDQMGVYVSRGLGVEGDDDMSEAGVASVQDAQASKKQFKEFIRQYQEGNFFYKYR